MQISVFRTMSFLVYDVSSRQSFERLDHWMVETDTYSTKDDAVKMIVANKIDMVSDHSGLLIETCK